MVKTRLSAFVSLLLVLLSGVVVGVVLDRVYNKTEVNAPNRVADRKQDPEDVRKRSILETKERVKLDQQQVDQLEKIFDDTKAQFDQLFKKRDTEAHEIWDNQRARIKAMLRPDQVPLFEKLQAEHDAERRLRRNRPPGDRK